MPVVPTTLLLVVPPVLVVPPLVDDGSSQLLYDKYRKYIYHKGGIAGDNPTLKQNEIMAVLEKGEAPPSKRLPFDVELVKQLVGLLPGDGTVLLHGLLIGAGDIGVSKRAKLCWMSRRKRGCTGWLSLPLRCRISSQN